MAKIELLKMILDAQKNGTLYLTKDGWKVFFQMVKEVNV